MTSQLLFLKNIEAAMVYKNSLILDLINELDTEPRIGL